MSKVIFVVLLAMALAATSAHGGRLDLFGTNNQLGCQKIPFLLCDLVCDACVCDRRAPEFAECFCGKWKPFGELPSKSEKTELKVATKPVAKSVGGFIPYPECMEKCDECVICTSIYPIEAALCYCGKKTETETESRALSN